MASLWSHTARPAGSGSARGVSGRPWPALALEHLTHIPSAFGPSVLGHSRGEPRPTNITECMFYSRSRWPRSECLRATDWQHQEWWWQTGDDRTLKHVASVTETSLVYWWHFNNLQEINLWPPFMVWPKCDLTFWQIGHLFWVVLLHVTGGGSPPAVFKGAATLKMENIKLARELGLTFLTNFADGTLTFPAWIGTLDVRHAGM